MRAILLAVLLILSCGCVDEMELRFGEETPTQATTSVSPTSPPPTTTSSTLAPVIALMVRIRDMAAHPKDVSIKRENAVSWLNDDPIAHDVTFEDFSSGPIPPGELYTHVFNSTGTFHYYCSIHKRYMEGTVSVT